MTVLIFSGYDPTNPAHKSWSRILSRQRYDAKQRNLNWTITAEYAWDMINAQGWKCALTGIDFEVGGKANPNQPSMDRIDPTRGYEPGNIEFITLQLNRIKLNLQVDEFVTICKKVLETRGN
jgi:hypothetical protein